MEENKTDKYEYLNAPCLLENFKNTYLASLNVFLNDDKFNQKVENLPQLKSSTITKYEKLIFKEEQEKLKKNKKKKDPSNLKKSSPSKIIKNINNNKTNKMLTMRYIILDHELVEITLQAIEESNEINSKLTDPFNAYFHENNEKIQKKALDHIVNSIFPKNINNNKEEENKKIFEETANSILFHDLKILEERYKDYEIDRKNKQEKYSNNIKNFNENCENHNIITLDQKIDYFVYLYSNGNMNTNKNIKFHTIKESNPNSVKKKVSRMLSKRFNNSQSISNNNASHIYERNNSNVDLITKYKNALKNNFKFYFDELNENYDNFEKELKSKIHAFELIKKNFENSQKFIDKLRMHLRELHVSNDKIILRECEINSEKFLFLLSKKYFDFSQIRHLNLSKNLLNDLGGSYLLTLIKEFGIRFDYLNISYNKLGKNSIEILIQILQENTIKINTLCIGGNSLGDKLFSELCIGISKNSFLNKLFVNDNDLGKISSVILGTILKYDKKIKLLDVSKNNFGDENIGYMLKGLICNTSLEILFLNDMNLTNKCLRVFETTLCINTTLKELFLERNKLNYKGWRLLAEILNKNKYIEYLSLVGNNFENEHVNLIAEQQRQVKIRGISKTDYFMQISALNDKVNFYEYFY